MSFVIFIDEHLADIDSLIAGLPEAAELVRIRASEDGIEQIAASLRGRSGIETIHIVSHGSKGALYLGS